MQQSEHLDLELNYEAAHVALNNLYNTFHDIPGYIREKTGEELALQAAKKVFGRFNPSDLDAMEANTNNGKGFTVELDDGQTIHLNNQLDLYNKVVAFNKAKGGFCDEIFIKHTNSADYQKLTDLQFKAEIAKDALIEAFPIKKDGYAKAREIETRAKTILAPALQNSGDSPANSDTNNTRDSMNSALNTPDLLPSPRMRVPLLSSIPNTFRQARTLFGKTDNIRADAAVTEFKASIDVDYQPKLNAQYALNLSMAAEINEKLKAPTNIETEKHILKLTSDFTQGSNDLNKIANRAGQIDEPTAKSYEEKMKAELEEMKERASKHPLKAIRDLLGDIVNRTADALKRFVKAATSLFTKDPSPAPVTS